jgi:hypothetical protein
MAINTTQRFLTSLSVFDTYTGKTGTIVETNFDDTSVPTLAPSYTGTYFVVQFDTGKQVFTKDGKRVDHTTGSVLNGVTLLTIAEYTSLIGAGYPAS